MRHLVHHPAFRAIEIGELLARGRQVRFDRQCGFGRLDRAAPVVDVAVEQSQQVVPFRGRIVPSQGALERIDGRRRRASPIARQREAVEQRRVLVLQALDGTPVPLRRLAEFTAGVEQITERHQGLWRLGGELRGLAPVPDGLLVPMLRPIGRTSSEIRDHRLGAEGEGAAEGFDGPVGFPRGERLLAGGQQVAVLPVGIEPLEEGGAADGGGQQCRCQGDSGPDTAHAPQCTRELHGPIGV